MIGISLGAVIVVCFLLLAAALGQMAKREVLKLSQVNVDNLTQQMARELSGGMDEFAREISTQATRDRFRSPTSTVEEMRAALDELKSERPDFAWIGIVDDSTGRIIAGTDGVFEQGDGRGRPVFERGRKGLFLGDVHTAVRLAELLPKPNSGEPLRFLDVGAPIRDAQGKTMRVLTAHLSWQWTNRLREELLGPLQERRGVEIMLVDSTGKLVLSPNSTLPVGTPIEQLAPNALAARGSVMRWSDGHDYVTASIAAVGHGRFPGFGWKVIGRQAVASAVAPAENLRNGFFIGALVLGLGTAAIAWWIAGRVIAPVRALAEAAMHTSLQGEVPHLQTSRIGEVAQMQNELSRLSKEGREHSRNSNARELQFITFADSLPDLVWQADAIGRINYANAQWLRVIGKFDGLHLDDLTSIAHPADLTEAQQRWQLCRQTGADLSAVVRLAVLPARSFEWFRLRGRAVRDNKEQIFGWVGTFSNINDSVLRSQRTEQELTQEREARAEVERTLRMKDEFLATLSHELRTPLNAISGWAQVLVRRPGIDPFVARAANVISRNVTLQATMISDLLDMSAVIGGEIVLQRVKLDGVALVADAVAQHQAAATDKSIVLSTTLPTTGVSVDVDLRRIRQVLDILLSNALKFTESGGRIHVTVLVDALHLVVKVCDNGAGIAAEFLPHIFDRFRQEDGSSTRTRGGLGLGLAIAKSLVELHHGSIRATSAGSGQGSELVVALPLLGAPTGVGTAPDQVVPKALAAVEPGLHGLRVLLVDDEPDAREAVAALLIGLGARVIVAQGAEPALALLTKQTIDLLICDIAMPVMDGYALIRQLRQGSWPTLPAIALSAFAMQQDQLRARQAGFDAHVAKPVTAERLLEAIRALLPHAPG